MIEAIVIGFLILCLLAIVAIRLMFTVKLFWDLSGDDNNNDEWDGLE